MIRKTKHQFVAPILASLIFAICICAAPRVNAADGDLLWSYDPGGQDNTSHGTPAIGLDGSIYYGQDFGAQATKRYLFAINQNGTPRFNFEIPNKGILEGYGCPSIGDDGTIYFATDTDTQEGDIGELFALNPNGMTLKWRSGTILGNLDFHSPAAIGTDGTAYISSSSTESERLVAAISSSGEFLWSKDYSSNTESLAAPSIGVDGTVYVASSGTYVTLRALNPANGLDNWAFDTEEEDVDGEGSDVPPAIGDDGTLYVAGTGKYVYAVRPPSNPNDSPTLKWKRSFADYNIFGGFGPPVVSPDGVVYVKSRALGKLFAIDGNTGTLVWSQPFETGDANGIGGSGQGSVAIAMDGTIYTLKNVSPTTAAVKEIKVIALNPDKSQKWVSNVPLQLNPEFGCPAIAANGTVLIADESGKLYAFSGSSPPAQTGWPMFMHDARRTGRATVPNNIYASYQHSLAYSVSDGQLYACGLNDYGQLGLGPEYVGSVVMVPTPIPDFANVREAVGGGEAQRHSVAVTRDGRLYAWGNNSSGQVGIGGSSGTGPIPSPVLIGPAEARWVTVAAGVACSFALRTDGTVYSWGSGSSGKLGLGVVGGGLGNYSSRYEPMPIQIPNTKIVDIKINHMTAYALDSDGYVWSWGHNMRGALGHGIPQSFDYNDNPVPKKIPSLSHIVAIEAGHTHCMALQITQPAGSFQVTRKVFLWGYNGGGELGNGQVDTGDHSTPWENPDFANATSIAAGSRHSFAVFEHLQPVSTVKGCGSNSAGELGIAAASPGVVVELPNWAGVSRISTGFKHTLGVYRDGNIESAGYNGNGQLGDPSVIDNRSTPGTFGPLAP